MAPPNAACGSWALPGPPQGVPRGGLRSLRELCLNAFNNKSKRRGGRLWEAPGGSGKLRGAPRGSVKRNLTVKADGSSRRLGGCGRLHEALRGSGGFHEAPGDSAIMNLTVKAYGSAGGSGRLQSDG